jgi:hypothetical protein
MHLSWQDSSSPGFDMSKAIGDNSFKPNWSYSPVKSESELVALLLKLKWRHEKLIIQVAMKFLQRRGLKDAWL